MTASVRRPEGEGGGGLGPAVNPPLAFDLDLLRVPAVPLSYNDLEHRQVVHTHLPLSPSSVVCYLPRSSDALRLGR